MRTLAAIVLAATLGASPLVRADEQPPAGAAGKDTEKDVQPLRARVASPLGVGLVAGGASLAVVTATLLEVFTSVRGEPTTTDDDKKRNEQLAQWGGFSATTGLAIGAGLLVAGFAILVSDIAPLSEPASGPLGLPAASPGAAASTSR